MAIINPIFTSTAYGFGSANGNSFYQFYDLNLKVKPGSFVTNNLKLLNLTLSNQWGYSYGLYSFIQQEESKGIIPAKTPILTDVDVQNGALFSSSGSRKFDVVLVGFSEYLSGPEFSNYKNFVQTGGKLIIVDACNFLAEVNYYPQANKISLYSGHGWAFNGSAAWPGVYNFWNTSATSWVGSIYGYFYTSGYKVQGAIANTSNPASSALRNAYGKIPIIVSYAGHEENYLTNSSDSVIAYWNLKSLKAGGTVAVYSHVYGKGVVIHTGIFATDVIASNSQMQFVILVSMLTQFT
ncbi:MAG: hypothetical protein OK457_09165 [Thaumarchaeota archaeon]|nr:hypothetical protein [Nitrososphaerota archaeon]